MTRFGRALIILLAFVMRAGLVRAEETDEEPKKTIESPLA
jgi:hypothetical protein